MVEEPPGFEPGIAALQAAALPLGDGSTVKNIWDGTSNQIHCLKNRLVG